MQIRVYNRYRKQYIANVKISNKEKDDVITQNSGFLETFFGQKHPICKLGRYTKFQVHSCCA